MYINDPFLVNFVYGGISVSVFIFPGSQLSCGPRWYFSSTCRLVAWVTPLLAPRPGSDLFRSSEMLTEQHLQSVAFTVTNVRILWWVSLPLQIFLPYRLPTMFQKVCWLLELLKNKNWLFIQENDYTNICFIFYEFIWHSCIITFFKSSFFVIGDFESRDWVEFNWNCH